jgi:hypothetical protein
MTAVIIIGTVALASTYLRWATGPVLAAYQIGRRVERVLSHTRTATPPDGTR